MLRFMVVPCEGGWYIWDNHAGLQVGRPVYEDEELARFVVQALNMLVEEGRIKG